MSMSVLVGVRIQEVAGEDAPPGSTLSVHSHRVENGVMGLVVLEFGDKSVTVRAADLKAAVERCVGLPG